MPDPLIEKYLDTMASQNAGSAKAVRYFLKDFEVFATSELRLTISDLVRKLKEGTATEDPKEEQVYRIMNRYANWIVKNRYNDNGGSNNARTIKLKISWARNFLETNFVVISNVIFKQHVKYPRPEDPELSPVSKRTVQDVIIACEDIRLQTYVIWLASMGWRARESLSVQMQHLEGLDLKTLKFTTGAVYVNVRGKHSKTRAGKRRRLTSEMKTQLEKWFAYKYRPRTINRQVLKNGKLVWNKKHVQPIAKLEDLVFAPYHDGELVPTLQALYKEVSLRFRQVVQRLGVGREESGNRHKITLHTLRRFVFTQANRAVDIEYARYHTGRKTHEYNKLTDDQIAEDFNKLEPVLTFLDTTAVEKQHVLLEKRLEKTEEALTGMERVLATLAKSRNYKWTTAEYHEIFKQLGMAPEEEHQSS